MTTQSFFARPKFFAVLLVVSAPSLQAEGSKTPLEVFEDRIVPIFKSPKPSSCVQCHLASVDLREYILPSHEATFASLRADGMIDLDDPKKSKILELITMGEKDHDRGAKLIHENTRKAEYEAFAAWIEACCKDPKLRALPAPKPEKRARPKLSDAVIRHTRKSRVLNSFVRNIWSQRMRCFPCHTPHEIDPENPKHARAQEKTAGYEEEFGKEVAERLKIFKKSPLETMRYLIADSRKTPKDRLPLVDLDHPRKSLLILKPTARLPKKTDDGREPPSYVEPVSHMGGLKMHVDDQSYKSFNAWIRDYSKVTRGEYKTVDELPADNWQPTQRVLMIRDTPEAWKPMTRVQLMVHAWDEKRKAWSEEPVAFTQGTITPRGRVVGPLFLFREKKKGFVRVQHVQRATLPAARYLIKAYLDQQKTLAKDPTAFLTKADFVGQAEIEAKWKLGFRNAEKFAGDLFVKEVR